MRSSRSSKGQPKWRLKAAPTLLLPAPMKPTRTMARTPETDADFVVSDGPPGLVLMYGGNLRRPHGPAAPHCRLVLTGLLQRFLRWILPLKENNRTEDAALFIVPAKALPALTTKGVCLGSSRKSFSTLPRTERAVTSMEASFGALASISPLWLAR